MTTREMIESALKRVEALSGVRGKLYKDATGWFVIGAGSKLFDSSSRSAVELLAYLHGLEDALNFRKEED